MDQVKTYPFTTRKDLAFEQGSVFDLEVISRSTDSDIINLIGMTREGAFALVIPSDNSGLKQTNIFRIPDIPISISVHSEAAQVLHGEQFVTVYLRINSTRVMRLCSGYIDSGAGISWPISQVETSFPNRGEFKKVNATDPGAGAEVIITVPSNELWVVHGVYLTLVTDGTAATRTVKLIFGINDSNIPLEVPAATTQTASLTRNYHFMNYGYLPVTGTGTEIYACMPPGLVLLDGSQMLTSTINLQAADHYTSARFAVEKFMISYTD